MTTIIAFDSETTNVVNPKIVEIGCLIDDPSKDGLKGYRDLVNPEEPISIGSMSIHNITEEMVADKPTINNTMTCMLMGMYNNPSTIFLGHNIGFDVIAYEHSTQTKILAKLIDTYKVSYAYFDDEIESYKLNYLRYYFKLNDQVMEISNKLGNGPSTAHSALFDSILSYCLFKKLSEKFTIEEMIEISSRPIIFKKLSFGKYKGKSFDEVAITDYQYVEWLFKSEMEKCKKKGMSDEEIKNNQFMATILFYLTKYDPKKVE